MTTYVDVHRPDPPAAGLIVNGDKGTWTLFALDRVQVYVHDPVWFDQLALWASREAARLREAQAAVEVCPECDDGRRVLVLLPGDRRVCAACAAQEVTA